MYGLSARYNVGPVTQPRATPGLTVVLTLLIWRIGLQGTAVQDARPTASTVCAVAEAPTKCDGLLVTMRATVAVGFETFAIRDPDNRCRDLIWLVYPDGGPAASVSAQARTPSVNRPPIVLKRDSRFKEFNRLVKARMYPRERGTLCIDCYHYEVTATVTGRIDVADPGTGFGHLNAFGSRLILQTVSEVSTRDLSSDHDDTKFSTSPVRFPTGYITGRVVGPDGKPVPDIDVSAMAIGDVPLYLQKFTESTDKSGRFRIDTPPGEYKVGANFRSPPSAAFPYPRTYSPSTTEETAAARFRVRDRQTVTVSIRLPTRLIERRYPVRVVWPDDTPVGEANAWLVEQPGSDWPVGDSVSHTRTDGRVELVGLEGIRYIVRAVVYGKPGFTPHCAEPLEVDPARPLNREIVLRLTRTGDVCR